ncbi:unnamed protein product [Pleuronectes platessa]|uniref:Uncharacterized protein n=1 Tax=Pleuronectes platessa TaxID=8262 RepID=A0A9N7Z4Y6_PLEPL|nr:unnamed protein product [Pleuronectes platessa]
MRRFKKERQAARRHSGPSAARALSQQPLTLSNNGWVLESGRGKPQQIKLFDLLRERKDTCARLSLLKKSPAPVLPRERQGERERVCERRGDLDSVTPDGIAEDRKNVKYPGSVISANKTVVSGRTTRGTGSAAVKPNYSTSPSPTFPAALFISLPVVLLTFFSPPVSFPVILCTSAPHPFFPRRAVNIKRSSELAGNVPTPAVENCFLLCGQIRAACKRPRWLRCAPRAQAYGNPRGDNEALAVDRPFTRCSVTPTQEPPPRASRPNILSTSADATVRSILTSASTSTMCTPPCLVNDGVADGVTRPRVISGSPAAQPLDKLTPCIAKAWRVSIGPSCCSRCPSSHPMRPRRRSSGGKRNEPSEDKKKIASSGSRAIQGSVSCLRALRRSDRDEWDRAADLLVGGRPLYDPLYPSATASPPEICRETRQDLGSPDEQRGETGTLLNWQLLKNKRNISLLP